MQPSRDIPGAATALRDSKVTSPLTVVDISNDDCLFISNEGTNASDPCAWL